MRIPLCCLALIFACAFSGGSGAQIVQPDTPEWRALFDPPYTEPTEVPLGSPLRKQLFDLLRPRLEQQAKRAVRFEGSLKAYKNWAIFLGQCVDKDGRPLKMPPMDNSDTAALWLRTKDGWRLVDYSGGHSDAFQIIWSDVYGAPAALVSGKTEP